MFRSVVGHFFKQSGPTLDNLVFRLHYRVTVGLLLVCAVALLWKINYGEPVNCAGMDRFSPSYLNNHCWYNGIFTVPSTGSNSVGYEVPGTDVDKQYHNIHRWVVIAVLVQAVFFYLPRIIWKSLEGRLIYRWTWSMGHPKKNSNVDMVRKKLIINYLRIHSCRNLLYTVGHVFCELLNLMNVVLQLFLVSQILQISFPSVDLFFLSRSERSGASPLTSFPLTTKCELWRYGPSGDAQRHDLTCFVSIYGLMESIFIYQWIWFALLGILSGLALLYRLVSLVSPQLRLLRLSAKANLIKPKVLERATRHLGIGEWFVLYMLSKNLDVVHMKDIVKELAKEMTVKEQSYQIQVIPEPNQF